MARTPEQNARYYQNRKAKASAAGKTVKQTRANSTDEYYYRLTQGNGKVAQRLRRIEDASLTTASRQDAITFARLERIGMYSKPGRQSPARRRAYRDALTNFYASDFGRQVFESGSGELVFYDG